MRGLRYLWRSDDEMKNGTVKIGSDEYRMERPSAAEVDGDGVPLGWAISG